jgi:hypothetical protein
MKAVYHLLGFAENNSEVVARWIAVAAFHPPHCPLL